jgi:hypothetical protein
MTQLDIVGTAYGAVYAQVFQRRVTMIAQRSERF